MALLLMRALMLRTHQASFHLLNSMGFPHQLTLPRRSLRWSAQQHHPSQSPAWGFREACLGAAERMRRGESAPR